MSTRLTFPTPAFIPRNSGIEYDTNGVSLKTIRGGDMFLAPVFLPHGANIDEVGMRVHDKLVTASAQIKLRLLKVRGNGFDKLAECVVPMTSPGDYDAVAGVNQKVDTAYGYVLQLELPAPIAGQTRLFYQAWVKYS